MDSLGISMSMALQHGVPLKDLVRKLAHLRFEPAGATNNPRIRFAQSIPDYVARWLALEFLTEEDRQGIGLEAPSEGNGTGHGNGTAAASTNAKAATFGTKSLDAFAPGLLRRERRRAVLPHLRWDHGALRHVLRLHDLRGHERLLVVSGRYARA